MEYVQSQLESTFGKKVEVHVQSMPKTTRVSNMLNGKYDVDFTGLTTGYNDPYAMLSVMMSGGNYNFGKWSNKQYDQYLTLSSEEMNVKKRLTDLVKAEQVLDDQQPLTPLYHDGQAWMVRRNVHGLVFNGSFDFRNTFVTKQEKIRMTKTAFVNCNLFVGDREQLLNNAWFVVDNETGKLTAKGTGKLNVAVEQQVDLDGQYVMSGLINAHTHVGLVNAAKDHYPETETLVTYKALKDLKNGLKGGVTYIRSCGVPFDVDVKLKNMRNDYPFEGPGMRPAGMPISILGGHADQPLGENHELNVSHLVNSPDDVRKAIKLMIPNYHWKK